MDVRGREAPTSPPECLFHILNGRAHIILAHNSPAHLTINRFELEFGAEVEFWSFKATIILEFKCRLNILWDCLGLKGNSQYVIHIH
jgi:hypothetical protein